MSKAELAAEAYARAIGSQSLSNFVAIFSGFMEKGIPESEIRPRENVFTFHAWKHQGRSVKKGEHGVPVLTWVPIGDDGKDEEKRRRSMRPRTAYVFHISQTQESAR